MKKDGEAMGPFERWIALAFPWLPPHSRDYLNLRAAWEAGFEAGRTISDPAE